MVVSSCKRKMVRFLVLSIYLWTAVVAKTNHSKVEMDFEKKQSTFLTGAYQNRLIASKTVIRRSKRRGETNEPLPVLIRAAALDYLNHSNHQSSIMAPSGFSLRCDNNLTRMVYNKFPMADLFWEFNGRPLHVDPSRTWYEPLVNELTMLVAEPEDSGVYACKMAQNWYWEQTVEFYVIQVQSPKPTLYLREWEAMTLRCNSELFDELFPGSSNLTWLHNGAVVYNGVALEGETIIVDHIKQADGGVWKCFVTMSERKWQTAHANVSVLPAISFMEKIMSQTKYTVAAVALVAACCALLFFICWSLAYWSDRRDQKETLYFEEQLQLLKEKRTDENM